MRISIELPVETWATLRAISVRERQPKKRASVAAVCAALIEKRVQREAARAARRAA